MVTSPNPGLLQSFVFLSISQGFHLSLLDQFALLTRKMQMKGLHMN